MRRPTPPGATRWRRTAAELGLDPQASVAGASRAPFGEAAAALVEEFRPAVVSFHFGLPAAPLLARVRATGARILSSATTVDEALLARGRTAWTPSSPRGWRPAATAACSCRPT